MQPVQILKKYFGYDSFREGQEVLIRGILEGKDVLGIMPTGAGKSVCYQIPALMLPGITIVISPLISLMKDQVRALNEAGVHAAYINSSLTESQISKALYNARCGQYKIIYVAPERLESSLFRDFAVHTDISMVTVDEAHCISQWGQDFRPSYLNILKLVRCLPRRPVISAFTATATEKVKEDIINVLGLVSPKVLVTGFDRKNLYFEVKESGKKDAELLNYLRRHAGESGIIYCATRKNVDAVFELLVKYGYSVAKYHAGMNNEERKKNQDDFIFDNRPLIVATNAFGMGIDKSNVRFVIHYNMPQSMENYYQEAGRAGRDGENADCILLYSPQDVVVNQFLIDSKEVRAEIDEREAYALRERDALKLRQMTDYCMSKDCLRGYILRYFGEEAKDGCGNCSNCLREFEEKDVTKECLHVINCVMETRQRFGINMIVGILRGEKNAKLLSYHFDRLDSYGKEKGANKDYLKQIIHQMIISNIACTTKDQYPILKLTGAAEDYIWGGEHLTMKVPKVSINIEQKPSKAGAKVKSGSPVNIHAEDFLNGGGQIAAADPGDSSGRPGLFEKLRQLRLEIAREEHMPPYIVFSDKTLVDMCAKLPGTKEEMLAVIGVGEVKYLKYGERFLEVLQKERA